MNVLGFGLTTSTYPTAFSHSMSKVANWGACAQARPKAAQTAAVTKTFRFPIMNFSPEAQLASRACGSPDQTGKEQGKNAKKATLSQPTRPSGQAVGTNGPLLKPTSAYLC